MVGGWGRGQSGNNTENTSYEFDVHPKLKCSLSKTLTVRGVNPSNLFARMKSLNSKFNSFLSGNKAILINTELEVQ